MKFFQLTIFLLSFISSSLAQSRLPEGWGFEVTSMNGKIARHTKNFKPEIPPFSYGMELNILKQTNGNKYWEKLHGFPQIGIGISFTHFGDDKVLGNAIGLFPNIYFPLAGTKEWSLNFRLSCGAAYLNRHYHVIENPTNNVIGSSLNNTTALGLYFEKIFTQKLSLLLSTTWTHFSNGHFQSPNLGINFASFNLAVRYYPNHVQWYHYTDSLPVPRKKWRLNVEAGFGLSDRSVPNGPKYPIYIGSFYFSRLTSLKNRLLIGTDAEYNKGVYDFEVHTENFEGQQKWVATRIAPFVADELLLNHLGITGQVGVYVHNAYLKQAPIYFKLLFKYYLFNIYRSRMNWFYGFSLKSHYAKAEFFEFSTGISF